MDKKTLLKISAVVSGLSGLIILLGVIFPILKYDLTSKEKFPVLLSPESGIISSNVLGASFPDSTKAENWFVGGNNNVFTSTTVAYYTISIPKLKILNATVSIGGNDLSNNLVQYPGTALPGRPGNSVIFGHSVLPIFYNPKDYSTIFSTLPTLKIGDLIDLTYDGIDYKYKIENMFEVHPTDIQVLEQDESDSFLTLVTCVPPGDPRMPKRLIVRARIVPFNQ
jgi:sortase A